MGFVEIRVGAGGGWARDPDEVRLKITKKGDTYRAVLEFGLVAAKRLKLQATDRRANRPLYKLMRGTGDDIGLVKVVPDNAAGRARLRELGGRAGRGAARLVIEWTPRRWPLRRSFRSMPVMVQVRLSGGCWLTLGFSVFGNRSPAMASDGSMHTPKLVM